MSPEPNKPAAKMPLLAGLSHTREELSKTTEVQNIEVVKPEKPTSAWDLQLKRIGPYQLVKVLGYGGVGTVFEAIDTNINRHVALKLLNKKWLDDEIAKERFLREAQLCARIKSQHVAMVHAVGEEDGVPYLAMEMLHGFSLEQLIYHKNLTIPQIVRLAREVAKGLSAAHLEGLIHRDIKPANIWLETLPNPTGGDKPLYRVKILDFGLARLQEQKDGLTRHGFVVGTPIYMSPEQATGTKIDARSDLFSLGVVLYKLCTGRLPFQGEKVADVMTAILKENPPPAREVNPEVPAKLSRLIERLMSKSPDKRPPDALNLTRLLEIIENEEEKHALRASKAAKAAKQAEPKTAVATSELQPFLKTMLIVSLITNLIMLIGIGVLIYVILIRQ